MSEHSPESEPQPEPQDSENAKGATPEAVTPEAVTPSRRDRLRPLELLGFSAVLGVFAGVVILGATRDIVLASIFAGVGFIVSILVVALVGLGGKPSQEDLDARKDLGSRGGTDWH